jgi:tol-pal system protein YbgF
MTMDSQRIRLTPAFFYLLGAALVVALIGFGCGSSEESTDQFETTPTVSPTAQLEYRVDSLKNENRRMKEQVDAVTTENRNLTAKTADLETKLNEAMAAQKQAPPPTVQTPTTAVSTGEMNSGYQAALDLFKKRSYSDAIEQFDGLLKAGIGDDLASNCHYWMGESYFASKKYTDAIQHFEMVFDYKKSSKKPAAQLMIGNAYLASGNKAAAKEAYEKVVANYPISSLAKTAQDKLAKMK